MGSIWSVWRTDGPCVRVHTTRFDESVDFYCESLGLELVEEWREGGHGAVIRLMRGADLELIELKNAGGYGGVALGVEVDDVDAVYTRLQEAGVKTNAPPIDAFGSVASARLIRTASRSTSTRRTAMADYFLVKRTHGPSWDSRGCVASRTAGTTTPRSWTGWSRKA